MLLGSQVTQGGPVLTWYFGTKGDCCPANAILSGSKRFSVSPASVTHDLEEHVSMSTRMSTEKVFSSSRMKLKESKMSPEAS